MLGALVFLKFLTIVTKSKQYKPILNNLDSKNTISH
jgi:hypothetical protein